MAVRAAGPFDLPGLTSYVASMLREKSAIIGCVLPAPLAIGALAGWPRLVGGIFGMPSRAHAYIEDQGGRPRSAALVLEHRRPEWTVLILVADPSPAGSEGAFRLLSGICAAAARKGMHRVFGSVPDEVRARETFFQAGFYSYTRETWFVSADARLPRPREVSARGAVSSDAHDLFRLYLATTPHAVQRAEQLSVQDFDVGRGAGALEAPHLVGGDLLAMRRTTTLIETLDDRARAMAVSFRGLDRHPHVIKARVAAADPERARELLRAVARGLPADRPLAAPLRSYEEGLGRGLLADGFRESATAMLFVKELAVRIEEPALAPATVRY